MLMFYNGLGMPVEWLAASPFSSYSGPGIILSVIVGGTHLLAALLLLRNMQWRIESVAVAGFGMMNFEFFELYITRQNHFLQIVYFFIGIGTVVAAFLLKNSTVR